MQLSRGLGIPINLALVFSTIIIEVLIDQNPMNLVYLASRSKLTLWSERRDFPVCSENHS